MRKANKKLAFDYNEHQRTSKIDPEDACFWAAALQQLTRLLADGSWVPMATVHFAAVTAALLAGWMAVRAKG